jgi:hypothetical protein
MSEVTLSLIADRLALLAAKVDDLATELRKAKVAAPAATPPAAPVRVDIDDPKFGDPQVRFDPRNWAGKSFKGARMSQCPPDYLRQLASALEYFAEKNDRDGAVDSKGNPKSKWDRLDAGRARAWAERLAGRAQAPTFADEQTALDEDLGF